MYFCVKIFLEALIEINFFNIFKPQIVHMLHLYNPKVFLIVVLEAVASRCS